MLTNTLPPAIPQNIDTSHPASSTINPPSPQPIPTTLPDGPDTGESPVRARTPLSPHIFELTNPKVLLSSHNALHSASTQVLHAHSLEECQELFKQLSALKKEGKIDSVTLSAGRRSFGLQAMPNIGEKNVVLDVTQFNQLHIHEKTEESVRVVMDAGVTFGQVIEETKRQGVFAIPSSMPTDTGITVGGALASNTHSRESHTTGFFADTVKSFDLITPAGKVLHCSEEENEDLYRLAPGSLGALGVMTNIEMVLPRYSEEHTYNTKILAIVKDESTFLEKLESFANRNLEQKSSSKPDWSGGVYSVFDPVSKKGIIFGSRIGDTKDTEFRDAGSLFMYGGSRFDHHLQVVGWRIPQLLNTAFELLIRKENACYKDGLIHAKTFQSTHIKAANTLTFKLLGPGSNVSSLPTVHQAFVVPPDKQMEFLELQNDLLNDEYKDRRSCLVVADQVPLPASKSPMSPCYNQAGMAHTITFQVNPQGDQGTTRVIQFMENLSQTAWEKLGVKVHLLKNTYCDPQLLQDMYRDGIDQLRIAKAKCDPDDLLSSQQLKQLNV